MMPHLTSNNRLSPALSDGGAGDIRRRTSQVGGAASSGAGAAPHMDDVASSSAAYYGALAAAGGDCSSAGVASALAFHGGHGQDGRVVDAAATTAELDLLDDHALQADADDLIGDMGGLGMGFDFLAGVTGVGGGGGVGSGVGNVLPYIAQGPSTGSTSMNMTGSVSSIGPLSSPPAVPLDPRAPAGFVAATAPASSSSQPIAEIGPHDVLLGRGQRSYDAPGTVLFRHLAQQRKAEYLASNQVKRKNAIAREIVDHVRTKLNPPGRFLRPVLVDEETGHEKIEVKKKNKKDKGGGDDKKEHDKKKKKGDGDDNTIVWKRGVDASQIFKINGEYWTLADEKQCQEKAKMTLRQKDYRETKKEKESAGGAAVAAPRRCGGARPSSSKKKEGTKAGGKGGGKGKRTRARAPSSASSDASSVASSSVVASPSPSLTNGCNDGTHANIPSQQTPQLPTAVSSSSSMTNNVDSSAAMITNQEQQSKLAAIDERTVPTSASGSTPLEPFSAPISPVSPQVAAERKREDILAKAGHVLALIGRHRQKGNVNIDDGSDLANLGSTLFRYLAGSGPEELLFVNPDTSSGGSAQEGDCPARKRSGDFSRQSAQQQQQQQQRRDTYSVLINLDVPSSLSAVVAALIEPTTDHSNYNEFQYETDSEVEEDVRLIMQDPSRYLYEDNVNTKSSGRFDLPGGGQKLYGRESQLLAVMQVFVRTIGSTAESAAAAPEITTNPSQREIVLLSGYSGTGKSTLVEQMRLPVMSRGGHFVSGKFDELGRGKPLSVIFSAFDELCGTLLKGDSERMAILRPEIIDALKGQGAALASTLPNLGRILSSVSSSSPCPEEAQIVGVEALNRFIFCFRAFVRAIAKPSNPIVVFFDDLQWADNAALEFITLLASDSEMSSMLLVGCYRDNEVGVDHPLTREIGKISSAGVTVNAIKLDNLNRDEVNSLVADSLRLLPRQTSALANIVHTKTQGNPLFAGQFLKSLCDERMLQYSISSRRWVWELDAIRSKDLAENVVGLMTKKMLRLDTNVQWFLKGAACLGYRSEESTLMFLADVAGTTCLSVVVGEGLMMRVGSSYKFSHDKVQQAAYFLIPPSERDATHLFIGRLLWDKSLAQGNILASEILFVIVDQLSRGADLIINRDERVKFAALCRMAGEKALASSSFAPAAIYLLQGSAMLDETDWDDNYELILRLFNKCAEAQYITGNYEGVSITLDPVLTNGKCLMDKVDAYYIMLNTLGAQGKQQDTLQFGLNFLSQFGESFPDDPQTEDVMNEFVKTKGMLDGISMDQLKEYPVMQDATKIATMKLMITIYRYAFQVNQNLMSLIVLRAVQISLNNGICRESSVAFASLGNILALFGDIQQGYQYGKLSLFLLDQFEEKAYRARVYCIVYGMLFQFVEPIQSSLPAIKQGHEEGMQIGDVEWAMILADMYSRTAVLCGGGKLMPLAEEIRKLIQCMKEQNHHMQAMTLPCLQAVLNLVDSSVEKPSVLTGEVMDEDEVLNKALENQRMNVVGIVYFFRLWLSYIFCDYDAAAEMAQYCQSIRQSRPFKGGNEAIETFYIGLVAAAMARREQQEEQRGYWRDIATEAIEKMKIWASNCPWNFQHKLDLLTAEISYTKGDVEAAAKAYDESIRTAKEHHFIHEQALANERAAIFFSDKLNVDVGQQYYSLAYKSYSDWGAARKARQIDVEGDGSRRSRAVECEMGGQMKSQQ